jgi:AcrR family transcriptional regulator
MAEGVAGGRRGKLNRRLVLQTALDLVDKAGLPALTLRRVADQLHVEAMSLYTWIDGREGLLDGIVELVVDQLEDDPEVLVEPAGDWRDFLTRLAYGVRRTALDHPKAFPLVATRPPSAPWIRPPLRSLRWVETFVSGLRRLDFSEDAAVYAYRAFTSFLLGYLLLETGAITEAALPGLPDQPPDGFADLDAERYPTIAALAPLLADNHAEEEFTDALHDLLDRIERQRGTADGVRQVDSWTPDLDGS